MGPSPTLPSSDSTFEKSLSPQPKVKKAVARASGSDAMDGSLRGRTNRNKASYGFRTVSSTGFQACGEEGSGSNREVLSETGLV